MTRIPTIVSTLVLVVASSACDVHVPLAAEHTTGPGSAVDCETPRTGNARELARGQLRAGALVIDDKYVYWVNEADGYAADGSVLRVPKAGGEPEVLAAGQAVLQDIAIDDEAVYWINRGLRFRNGKLMRRAKAGGEAIPLATEIGAIGALAVDDQYVYLNDDTIVERIPKLGGAPQPIAQLASDGMLGIALDDRRVYFTEMTLGSVQAVAKAGGATAAFTHTCTPGRVVAKGGYVYWTACLDVSLYRASSPSEPAVALVPGKYAAFHVAVASDRIYFSSIGGFNVLGGIYQIDAAGRGDIELLTGGGCGYFGVAADATSVYFTNYVDGTVSAVDR